MSTNKLYKSLEAEIDVLASQGRTKILERIITACIPAQGESGPRYRLSGSDNEYSKNVL